jgi:hypothetical protein
LGKNPLKQAVCHEKLIILHNHRTMDNSHKEKKFFFCILYSSSSRFSSQKIEIDDRLWFLSTDIANLITIRFKYWLSKTNKIIFPQTHCINYSKITNFIIIEIIHKKFFYWHIFLTGKYQYTVVSHISFPKKNIFFCLSKFFQIGNKLNAGHFGGRYRLQSVSVS